MPEAPFIIAHQNLIEPYESLIVKSSQNREDQIATQLRKAQRDPPPEKLVRGIPFPKLQGKVYSFHVGRRDYRMICILWDFRGRDIVLVPFLSTKLRKNFDIDEDVDFSVIKDVVEKLGCGKEYIDEYELWRIEEQGGEKTIIRKKLEDVVG